MLLTDVEGSTRLWEAHPDRMREAIRRHHEIAHHVIHGHQGYRPPDQGEGDSVFAVFADPARAVGCAVDLQRAFASERWPRGAELRVRMALHTGLLHIRDGRNYAGTALNRCARLRAIAHGGQVLLSETARAMVEGTLGADLALKDLGIHRLKDLSMPERVYQLCQPGLPSEFPPLLSMDARPNNLPVQLTRFVGRDREMKELRALLGTTRLLTLTGTGGAGKTRLAIQLAAELLEEYPEGIWLVELAGIRDPALVPRVIASATAVREQQGRPVIDALVDSLSPKAALIVLDTCEHLVLSCAEVAFRLLGACPRLAILATSREPLAVPGETLWRVPSLSVPGDERASSWEEIAESESVQLFLDRAVAASQSFSLDDESGPSVARICRRLDGIPLAIELAAARLQALSVEQIRDRLDDRFRLLAAGSRTVLPRQQTLRAAVDWSHDLLMDKERVLLRRLSVFAGGFTVEAAEHVCGVGQVGPAEVLDLLVQLVTKSLVVLESRAGPGRYGLLDTLREYGLEKLLEAGEDREFRRRHLEWCIDFAEAAEPELHGAEQEGWLERLHAELDNFRAAFGWSLAQSDPERALRLASALLEFWVVRADWSEGRQWVEEALALPGDVDPAYRMKGLAAAGELADVLSDYPAATACFEESLTLARRLGDKRAMAEALIGLVHEAERVGRFRAARPLLEEAVSLLKDVGDEPSLARSLGGLAWMEERYSVARALAEENLSIRRRLGNRESVGWSVLQVGVAAQGEGDYASAREAYEESLAIGRELAYKRLIARSLTQIAELAYTKGDVGEAAVLYEQTLPTWEEIRHRSGLLDSLRGLGDIARVQGDHDRAESLLRQSLTVCQEIGAREGEVKALQSLAELAQAKGDPSQAMDLHRDALRLADEMEQTAEIGTSVGGMAQSLAVQGRFDPAVRLLGAAESLRERVGAPLHPCNREGYERAVQQARRGLDPAGFGAAWAAGRGMDRTAAVAFAFEATASGGRRAI